jgi:putative endonuclease
VARRWNGLANLAHQLDMQANRAGIHYPVAYRPTMTDAWVYILRCADGSLYTGWSVDVPKRLERHQAGKASRYTASRLPVELVYEAAMDNRTAARREEVRIKALDRRAKLALIDRGRVGDAVRA